MNIPIEQFFTKLWEHKKLTFMVVAVFALLISVKFLRPIVNDGLSMFTQIDETRTERIQESEALKHAGEEGLPLDEEIFAVKYPSDGCVFVYRKSINHKFFLINPQIQGMSKEEGDAILRQFEFDSGPTSGAGFMMGGDDECPHAPESECLTMEEHLKIEPDPEVLGQEDIDSECEVLRQVEFEDRCRAGVVYNECTDYYRRDLYIWRCCAYH